MARFEDFSLKELGVIICSRDPKYTAKALATALDGRVPPEVNSVRKKLEDCVRTLKRLEGRDET